MLLWKNIVPGPEPPIAIYALVEVPKGSKNKYEISKKANIIVLDRPLHSSVVYPHDYGLIPGTLAQDDDPLDVLILGDNPVHPLTLIQCRPVGVLIMEDEKGIDEKILAVDQYDPVYRGFKDLRDVPDHYLAEIQEFYRTYKNLENTAYSEVRQWQGALEAHQIILESIQRFRKEYGDIATCDPMHD